MTTSYVVRSMASRPGSTHVHDADTPMAASTVIRAADAHRAVDPKSLHAFLYRRVVA